MDGVKRIAVLLDLAELCVRLRATGRGRMKRVAVPLVLAAGMAGASAAALAEGQEEGISLQGVVDLHFHTGPDSRPRSVDDIEASRLAAEAGMRAILLKNHFTMTADRAAIAMGQVDGLEIFGGLVLNRAVGGINPEAVRQMASFSGGRGKVVWLPTFDSEYAATSSGGAGPYVSILEDGEPLPAVLEVFELLAQHDLTLAMGHSAPDEVLRLLPEARRIGVPRILVTHVFSQGATREQMRQMAADGAIMEIDWLAVYGGNRTIEDYVSAIRDLGAEAFFMSSDLGQEGNPVHADGLRAYVRAMRDAGITEREIDTMLRRNPARLLGLDPW